MQAMRVRSSVPACTFRRAPPPSWATRPIAHVHSSAILPSTRPTACCASAPRATSALPGLFSLDLSGRHAVNSPAVATCTFCRPPPLPKPALPCTSSIRWDANFEECQSFCSPSEASTHCGQCKCKACGFCKAKQLQPPRGGKSNECKSPFVSDTREAGCAHW